MNNQINNFLLKSRAGRMFLSETGLNKTARNKSFFSYKVGNNAKKENGDYYLYFNKQIFSPKIISNFAFLEILNLGIDEGLKFLEFQVNISDNRDLFLKYLAKEIPERKKSYSKPMEIATLDNCLNWVNQQLKKSESETSHNNGPEPANAENQIEVLISRITEFEETLNNNDSKMNDFINTAKLGERGSIKMHSDSEFKQFVFLILALQNYHIDNDIKKPGIFSKMDNADIHRLFKWCFEKYNHLKIKAVEKNINAIKEEYNSFDQSKIDKSIKNLFSCFSKA